MDTPICCMDTLVSVLDTLACFLDPTTRLLQGLGFRVNSYITDVLDRGLGDEAFGLWVCRGTSLIRNSHPPIVTIGR